MASAVTNDPFQQIPQNPTNLSSSSGPLAPTRIAQENLSTIANLISEGRTSLSGLISVDDGKSVATLLLLGAVAQKGGAILPDATKVSKLAAELLNLTETNSKTSESRTPSLTSDNRWGSEYAQRNL